MSQSQRSIFSSKVDLEQLRRAKAVLEADWFKQGLASAGVTLSQLLNAQNTLHWGWFCCECGEEQPSGWSQVTDGGPDKLSSLLCRECADRLIAEERITDE